MAEKHDGWCVFFDDGTPICTTFAYTKSGCIRGYMKIWDPHKAPKWRSIKRREGLTVHKVRIVPVKDK